MAVQARLRPARRRRIAGGRSAGTLTRTIRATALLGCQAIVCGVGPQIARTFVDLDHVTTRGSVRKGLTLRGR